MEAPPPLAVAPGPAGPACALHPLETDVRRCQGCGRSFCSNCLIPLRGQQLCGDCKHLTLCRTFRHDPWADYTVRVEPVPPVSEGMLPGKPPCAQHPANAARANCERCGDFMCALCDTNFEGRRYCIRCLDLLWTRGQLVPPQTPGTATASLILGICSLVFFCSIVFTLPLGGTAVGLGIAALSRIAKNPGTPGRGIAVAGIICGVMGILLSIGMLFLQFPFW